MEGFCRGCLIKYNEPMELLQYTEKNRRLFVYSTGLQVKRNDTFTFQLCKDCYLNMKLACKFKKLCRTSDKRFKNYLGLKDVGDPLDFCTFLKNSDDTLTFRLPMASGNSTPANQKCRDDDNESTCTSIRNFMTDILQGEEMPDTEARIIKEVIEEEADVLDDSLDSHWLQDDMSIDTDFRLDFSFSPFSTPRTVNNDRCFTPKKLSDQKEEQVNFYTLNNEKQNKIPNDFTNAFKVDQKVKEFLNSSVHESHGIAKSESNTNKNDQNFQELCDFSLDDIDSIEKSKSNSHKHDQSMIELCDLGLNDIEKSESNSFESGQSEKELCDFSIDVIDGIEKSQANIGLPLLDDLDKDKINIQNFYIPKDDIGPMKSNNDVSNSSINIEALLKDKSCTIDRNLEEALKNADNKEFSLDELLVSPPVFQGASAASTPTITNILFGEKLDLDNNINSKIEQCIKTSDDVQRDIEIFEEFFQNDTREFDLEDIKRENVGIKTEDTKEPIGFGNVEVDKENQSKNNYVNISINLENDLDMTELTKEKKEIKKIETTTPSHDERFDLENFYCYLCSKKFQSARALSIHFVKSHHIKIIKPKQKVCYERKLCNACGKDFRDTTHFRNHLKNCSKPKQIYKCDRCPVECTTPARLKRHVATHDPTTYIKKNTGKEYVCTICGAIINKLGNYQVHVRRHTKNYITHCKKCGKGFYTSTELVIHMRSHTGETPFACKFCERLFARKDVLTRHLQIHMGQKLFQCDHCGKKYYKKYELKRHLSTKACLNNLDKVTNPEKKKKVKEQVTVIYAKGDDKAIRKQLPFLETDMSN